jgi:hypothetical protein
MQHCVIELRHPTEQTYRAPAPGSVLVQKLWAWASAEQPSSDQEVPIKEAKQCLGPMVLSKVLAGELGAWVPNVPRNR